MCSMYWNIEVEYSCPKCHIITKDEGAQTHFQGEVGSCVNYYKMNEPVPELAGLNDGRIEPPIDSLISTCSHCGEWVDLGFEVKSGSVVSVWPLRNLGG